MSTYPVVLPAPCHNGWAKGSGWVHAGSSVGNLSEQSLERRVKHVQQIQHQNNEQDIFKITGAALFASNQLGGELHHGLVPLPSHSHFVLSRCG